MQNRMLHSSKRYLYAFVDVSGWRYVRLLLSLIAVEMKQTHVEYSVYVEDEDDNNNDSGSTTSLHQLKPETMERTMNVGIDLGSNMVIFVIAIIAMISCFISF